MKEVLGTRDGIALVYMWEDLSANCFHAFGGEAPMVEFAFALLNLVNSQRVDVCICIFPTTNTFYNIIGFLKYIFKIKFRDRALSR